jgi:predicted ATPase
MSRETPASPPAEQPLRLVALGPQHGMGALPTPLTSFVGREREVAAVSALLRGDDARLVTLTGPGGIGKTRLAVQVAGEVSDAFPDGVWFVDLAPIADPRFVAGAVAQALGVREASDETLIQRLQAFLRGRRLLLVLDNFEQVLEAAALVIELLTASPGLTVLVTSRVRLRLSGERTVRVPPLGLPAAARPPAAAADAEGVRLFVARAQAIEPTFALREANAEAVAAVCQRLEGLPLAIELAAARSAALPPAALLQRLGKRLPLLVDGPRDQPARLRTMRGAIAWSHDLLTQQEQALFRRLGVFAAGFALDAAEAVVGGDGLGSEVGGGVAALVDASLLRREDAPGEGEPRYAMLETVREYALEQLAASGEEPAVRRAHADYFLRLAEAAHDAAHQGTYRSPLTVERANLRAALAWLETAEETERNLLLVGALWPFWYVHGPYQEGRGWVERALARGGDASPMARGRAVFAWGQLAAMQGDTARAAVCFEECLAVARAGGFTLGATGSLFGLASVAMQREDFAGADELVQQALELIWQTDDPRVAEVNAGLFLSHLGSIAYARGDFGLASTRFADALGRQRATGHHWGEAFSLTGLGYVARAQGDDRLARAHLGAALPLFREHEDWADDRPDPGRRGGVGEHPRPGSESRTPSWCGGGAAGNRGSRGRSGLPGNE